MPHVANKVCPGDAVSGLYEPRVGDGPKGFANVRGVRDVAVGRKEDCSQARSVRGIAEVGICGLGRAEEKGFSKWGFEIGKE